MVLIWLSFVSPRPVKRHDRLGRTREALDRAGLTGTSVTGLWAVCAATAMVVFVAVEVVSRTVSVSLAFGSLAGYLPVAMVVGRGRRQREITPMRGRPRCVAPATGRHTPFGSLCSESVWSSSFRRIR